MSATTYAPSFQISSDKRLKSNIKPIEDGLEKVTQLTGCTFDKVGVDHNTAGLIAQEVESILPQAVSNNADGYKSIDYSAVVGLLVQAIKQLNQKVEQLKSQPPVTE